MSSSQQPDFSRDKAVLVDKILWGDVSLIEFWWVAIYFLCLVVGAYNLWDSVFDKIKLKQGGVNGLGDITVDSSIVTELGRFVISMCFITVGIFSMYAPPSPLVAADNFYWWYRLVLTGSFLIAGHVQLLLIINSRVTRIRTLTEYDKLREQLRKGG